MSQQLKALEAKLKQRIATNQQSGRIERIDTSHNATPVYAEDILQLLTVLEEMQKSISVSQSRHDSTSGV